MTRRRCSSFGQEQHWGDHHEESPHCTAQVRPRSRRARRTGRLSKLLGQSTSRPVGRRGEGDRRRDGPAEPAGCRDGTDRRRFQRRGHRRRAGRVDADRPGQPAPTSRSASAAAKCSTSPRRWPSTAGIKMVTCPTIASNDSPTSAASVWYDENHNFVGFDCWPFNPDIVLVDTQVDRQRSGTGLRGRDGRRACPPGSKPKPPSSRGPQHRRRTPHHGRHGPGTALLRNADGARHRRQTRRRTATSLRRPSRRSSRPTCCFPAWASRAAGWPPPT